jgi:hypothetical protein
MATPVVLINGVNYSWINATIPIFGIPLIGITKFMVKRSQVKENNYGRGAEPVSRGYGRKEYEASITVYFDELAKIIAANGGQDITDIPPFDFPLVLAGTFVGFKKITIKSAEFTQSLFDSSEGDTKILVELPLIIGGVNGL